MRTNELNVTQAETIELPPSKSQDKMAIVFKGFVGSNTLTELASIPISIPNDFKGELYYKIEGTIADRAFSTCDDMVGETFGDSRHIRFQNEAGCDAEMIVIYDVDEVINGQTMMMPRTVATGMINGLGGKYRIVAIPKNTSKGQPITIVFQSSTTEKNDIRSTTLPADSTDNPRRAKRSGERCLTRGAGRANRNARRLRPDFGITQIRLSDLAVGIQISEGQGG